MRDGEWFSGVISEFSGDGMVGSKVLVSPVVFKELGGMDGGYVNVNGYKIYGDKKVRMSEMVFPGYER